MATRGNDDLTYLLLETRWVDSYLIGKRQEKYLTLWQDRIEKAQTEKRKPVIWTSEQVQTFLAVVDDPMYRTLFYLFLTTGLRRGEALGLEWTSFTDDGQVEVKQQALNHPGGIVMGPPKSKLGERFVRIPEDTKQLLKAYKDKQAEELGENSKWVFTDSSGRLINPNLIYRRFQSFVRKAGVPRYTLHDLRHWNISNKVADPDLDVATVSSEAGHRNLTMTLDTYSHVLQRAQVRTAKTLEDYGVEKGAVN